MTNALRKIETQNKDTPCAGGLTAFKTGSKHQEVQEKYLFCHSNKWQLLWEKSNSKQRYPLWVGLLPSKQAVSIKRYRRGIYFVIPLNDSCFEKNQTQNKYTPLVGGLTAFKASSTWTDAITYTKSHYFAKNKSFEKNFFSRKIYVSYQFRNV